MSRYLFAGLRASLTLPVLLLAPFSGSCTVSPVASICPVSSGSVERITYSTDRRKFDLLLVVDNSDNMVAKQQALATTFGELMLGLAGEGHDYDYHVGVVSTDVGSWVAPGQPWTMSAGACDSFAGDDGQLQAIACTDRQDASAAAVRACSELCPDRRFIPMDGTPFIRRHNGVTNVPVALATDPKTGRMIDRGPEYALKCMAILGEGGCQLSSPLEAMKRALDGHLPGNQGFLRADSVLQIIILTDKDDCSVQPARRSENDPHTRSCALPDANAAYDCFTPAFRCLARDLACDQPLNTAGNKTGCHERADTYLQPVDDYVRFLLTVVPAERLAPVGLWTLPALDAGGRVVVTQDAKVAGSAGLRAGAGAQAACQAMGDPSYYGQPQLRLSHWLAALPEPYWLNPMANICDPQDYSTSVLAPVENQILNSAVLNCLSIEPKLRPDGTPDCVVGDVPSTSLSASPSVVMPVCNPRCCAAMADPKNYRWSWSWNDATVAACRNETVDCFCLPRSEACGYGSNSDGTAVGIWRAGNADQPPSTVISIRCAVEDQMCQALQ